MNRLTPGRLAQEAGRPSALPARSRVKLVLHRGIVTGTIPGGTRLVQSCIGRARGEHPPGPGRAP
jgi:hypothetical protein